MKFTIIVILETERSPQSLIGEIVSNLEYDISTHTIVDSVVVLIDDATEVAIYDRKEQK